MTFIHRLPLHIVSSILDQLDTIAELGIAIRSHRIFYNAFKYNAQTICRSILSSQIPPNLFPYANALLESSVVDPSNHDSVKDLLRRLQSRIKNDPKSLERFPVTAYAALSRALAAVEILREDLISEALPLFMSSFEADHASGASQQEIFRLNRAFMRYQIMCNLFCTPYDVGSRLIDEYITQYFFHPFSPWVNEQILCVYRYLERKVAEAYDDVAAHDVDWGKVPVEWDYDANVCSMIQWNLGRGLPVLLSIIRATNFEERRQLLPMHPPRAYNMSNLPFQTLVHMLPENSLMEALNPNFSQRVLDECTEANFQRLCQPLDGVQDDISSTPYLLWRAVHSKESVSWVAVDWELHKNHWDCACFVWDLEKPQRSAIVQERSNELSDIEPFFPRLQSSWEHDDKLRSEKERWHISLAGGQGYWSSTTKDFNGITGLRKDQQDSLLKRFKDWEEKGIGHTWHHE
ncbi:hypothetical protein CGCF415_v009509 [Colletotrichum fructicola]|nr:hypothetical protein CGCF415_v009509 [Colletotrichum fructicola]KAF4933980.1 hypothetical protein CGCF245_v009050 [Colletotrichum fructicola]KAF5496140.1 hypothetical protein CGCF413_v009247 [Colletotrichum fructicola]